MKVFLSISCIFNFLGVQIDKKITSRITLWLGKTDQTRYNVKFYQILSSGMKYLIIIANGLTDDPIAEKNNLTPLQIAETPNLDRLATEGRCGSTLTIPEGLLPGNDVSFLSLLGYDPIKYKAGAASFDILSAGISLEPGEIPLCCDFVSLQSGHNDMVMKDYTGGQLSKNDSEDLLKALQDQVFDAKVRFHSLGSYHNVATIQELSISERLTPPDELIGEGIRDHMPAGKEAKALVFVLNQAQIILHNHPLGKKLKETEKDPVNSVWFWGNGPLPKLPPFEEKYTFDASVVSASSLFQGMAKAAGMDFISKGTGFMDTDYQAKAETALEELKTKDVVYLQVSAPERASMQGSVDDKILAIEDFDKKVLGPIMEALAENKELTALLTVNHFCSANQMRFGRDPVPFAVYPSRSGPDAIETFDEQILSSETLQFESGPSLISALFKGEL